MVVLIYQGDNNVGVASDDIESLKRHLQSIVPHVHIKMVDCNQVKPNTWNGRTVFVLPGGICTIWDKQLNPETLESLKTFFQDGGDVLGICAGAFFGAKQSIYTIGQQVIETSGKRLSCFPGIAIGPLLSDNHCTLYETPQTDFQTLQFNAQVIKIRWEEDRSEGWVLINGGGYFDSSQTDQTNYDVIARYIEDQNGNAIPKEKSAAIISGKVGKGVYVLSFVHLECDAQDIPVEALRNAKASREKIEAVDKIFVVLQQSQAFRTKCLTRIFEYFMLIRKTYELGGKIQLTVH